MFGYRDRDMGKQDESKGRRGIGKYQDPNMIIIARNRHFSNYISSRKMYG